MALLITPFVVELSKHLPSIPFFLQKIINVGGWNCQGWAKRRACPFILDRAI